MRSVRELSEAELIEFVADYRGGSRMFTITQKYQIQPIGVTLLAQFFGILRRRMDIPKKPKLEPTPEPKRLEAKVSTKNATIDKLAQQRRDWLRDRFVRYRELNDRNRTEAEQSEIDSIGIVDVVAELVGSCPSNSLASEFRKAYDELRKSLSAKPEVILALQEKVRELSEKVIWSDTFWKKDSSGYKEKTPQDVASGSVDSGDCGETGCIAVADSPGNSRNGKPARRRSTGALPPRTSDGRKRRNLTPEQVMQMQQMYAAGSSIDEIATEFTVTASCVRRRLGIVQVGRRRKNVTAEQKAEIVALRDQGLTCIEIAERLGLTESIVQRHSQKGIRPRHHTSPEMIAKIRELFESGMQIKEVASELGIWYGTVSRYVGGRREANEAEIRQMYQSGMSIADICRQVRLGQFKIEMALGDLIRHELDHRKLTEGDILKARAMKRQGHSIVAIALQIGCKQETISEHVANVKAEVAPIVMDHGGMENMHRITATVAHSIRGELQAGRKPQVIADDYAVSMAVIHAIRPMNVRYNAEEKAELIEGIRACLAKGMTRDEVADEWGVTLDTVETASKACQLELLFNEAWIQIFGIEMPPAKRPTKAPPGSLSKIAAMRERWLGGNVPIHADDATGGDIIGYDVLAIRGMVEAEPLVSKYAKPGNEPKRNVTDAQKEAIAKMIAKGATVMDIAAELNIYARSVQNYVDNPELLVIQQWNSRMPDWRNRKAPYNGRGGFAEYVRLRHSKGCFAKTANNKVTAKILVDIGVPELPVGSIVMGKVLNDGGFLSSNALFNVGEFEVMT